MTLSAQITSTGIVVPTYEDILADLEASFRTIYGSDIVLTPDSQDGQMLAVFAAAINDANQALVSTYNAFSPAKAVGAGLSSVVKINGLARQSASRSTVVLTLVGQVGTIITNGIVGDNQGLSTQWALPASVTIPISGEINVTATCTSDGAVSAASATLTEILTPTRGWQTVNNIAAATPGDEVETDAELRRRQAASTSLPAETVLSAIYASVVNLSGIARAAIYENDTNATDSNGLPEHSISLVVEGGDVNEIANAIALKKTPGTATYGTTSVDVVDPAGVPNTINFFELELVEIDVVVNVTALTGYVSTTTDLIKEAIAEFLNSLDVGEDSYYGRLWAPADLNGDAATISSGQSQADLNTLSKTYKVTSITQCVHGGTPAASDVAIAFNQAASGVVANITVNVV